MDAAPGSVRTARFGPFQVDFRAGELHKHGVRIRLQDQPLEILAMLLRFPGEVVTREELQQRLWPGDTFVDFDHGLNNAINRLREALADSAENPRYVETLPRRGYRFIAPVEKEGAAEPAATSAAAPLPPHRAETPRAPSRMWIPAALGVVALLTVLTIGLNVSGWRDRLFAAGSPRPAIRSIAVLPFENLTSDPGQEYFVDGMTVAIIAELAQIGSLEKVISQTSAMQYKGMRKPLPEIARELKVDALVEGAVVREGSRVSIRAQLVEGSSDKHIWARTFDRDVTDILSLQREIARTIAQELQIQLTPGERAHLAQQRAVNPAAYDSYLQAQGYLGLENREDNDAAIRLLERAVVLDPEFPEAHAALAIEYVIRLVELTPEERQWEEKAYAAAQRAIALGPDLPDSHVARGRVLWTLNNHFPHEQAIREYRRALELNPNHADAHHQLANIYNHVGLLEKGTEEIEKAVALDPLNTAARFRVGINLLYQGRYEESLVAIQGSQRFFPRLWAFQTSFALLQLGRRDEAAARVEEFLKKDPKDAAGLLTSMQAVFAAAAGDQSTARQKIALAIRKGDRFQHFHHTSYAVASAYALMGESDMAVRWLERVAAEGFPCYPLFEKDSSLDRIRRDPRFLDFLARQKKQWEHFKASL